jgi:hypothetical protein
MEPHVHKRSLLVPIVSQINSINISPANLRSILIISYHICIGVASGLFLSVFPKKILHAFLCGRMPE